MPHGVRILGVKSLQRKFRGLTARVGRTGVPEVYVGFTAAYAVYVHENKQASYNKDSNPKAQPKFLEQPAREKAREIGRVIRQAVKAGATLEHGLYLGGLRLQREAQDLTPRDTGNLMFGAFTAQKRDVPREAAAARARGEARRKKG